MTEQILAVAVLVSAIIGAVVAITRAAMWLWAVLRQLARLADDLTGEPPRPGIHEGRPGVLARLASIEGHVEGVMPRLEGLEQRLAAVEAQLLPNGGGSLRDAVERLATPAVEEKVA